MYPNPLNVTLRNLKTFNGLEGQGFSATMYVDGVMTAEVIDDANGGCYNISACYDRKTQKPAAGAEARLQQVEDFIKTLPPQKWPEDFGMADDSTFQPDLDGYLSEMVEAMENARRQAAQLTRARKTNTLFRLKTDTPQEFRTVKCLDVARVKAMLDKKYGADGYDLI